MGWHVGGRLAGSNSEHMKKWTIAEKYMQYDQLDRFAMWMVKGLDI